MESRREALGLRNLEFSGLINGGTDVDKIINDGNSNNTNYTPQNVNPKP